MGGWIVQVSNPASPKDTTRICRRQGRGNPPLVAKTRCDQILLFSACQKDGCNAQFAILNKKGAPMPQYWDLQLQHRCALKRLKKVRAHYGSPQKRSYMLGGLISRQTYVLCLIPLYQMFPLIATRFFAICPPCAIPCAFCTGFSIFKMALKSYFRT